MGERQQLPDAPLAAVAGLCEGLEIALDSAARGNPEFFRDFCIITGEYDLSRISDTPTALNLKAQGRKRRAHPGKSRTPCDYAKGVASIASPRLMRPLQSRVLRWPPTQGALALLATLGFGI